MPSKIKFIIGYKRNVAQKRCVTGQAVTITMAVLLTRKAQKLKAMIGSDQVYLNCIIAYSSYFTASG